MGKGQNYKNQNVKIQKEHQKKFKGSEHRKCLFSSSLLRHQNIKKCLFSDRGSLDRISVDRIS
jgi:hypothetical protein